MTLSELQSLWQRVDRVARLVALLKRLDRCQTFLEIAEVENLIREELKTISAGEGIEPRR
jgi:hypothetical protein